MTSQIQLRRGTASAWTTANTVLAAGEQGYETDTGKTKIGDGTTAWNSLAYSINKQLAPGADGTTLVANSASATGMAWAGPTFTAGKNKIINGDFGIWQRGTSFSNPTDTNFLADRFNYFGNGSGKTVTVSQQAFTPGAAPVAGYEGKYFLRIAQTVAGTGATYQAIDSKIEDVQTLAGQTFTFSFWMKMSSATNLPSVTISQDFGSGGSSRVLAATLFSNQAITTSWVRYSASATFPSLTGKTIGTGSSVLVEFNIPINTAVTTDIWGVQLEAGSVATPFTTATGTLQGELAAAQRYFEKSYDQSVTPGTASSLAGIITAPSSAVVPTSGKYCNVSFKVSKRIAPSVTIYSYTGTITQVSNGDGGNQGASSGDTNFMSEQGFTVINSTAGNITPSRNCFIFHFTASSEL